MLLLLLLLCVRVRINRFSKVQLTRARKEARKVWRPPPHTHTQK